MAAPIEDSRTSESQIVVNWAALSTAEDTGASPIVSYVLEWDQSTGSWQTLVGDSSDYTSTTYTQTSGVTAGNTY